MHGSNIYKQVKIKYIREEVSGFKTFVFEDGHGISYKAGQYLTLVRFDGKEEIRRSYSITSSPVLNEPLSIGVKRVPNGFFSRLLTDDASEGDPLLTTGAGGFFLLPENIHAYKQVFFFAAGSGITPIYSLIKTALRLYYHLNIVLVYSNASPEKAVFLDDLKKLQQQFSGRFHIEWVFSNSAALEKARLHRDMLLHLLRTMVLEDKSQVMFYTCGPEAYMRLCIYTLQENGVPAANIKRENFFIHTIPRSDQSPPDKNERKAYIRLNGQLHTIEIRHPDSILKAAKRQGISLPYSCEAGRCGNCVAKCIKGKVWHSYNEVLTEKELQQGLVLTCVAHPVDGDVELQID